MAVEETAIKELVLMAGSAVGEVVNSARDAVFGVFDDEIGGFQWSAILDQRTCKRCRRLDGRVFLKGDPALDLLGPQLHQHCRCIRVAVKKEETDAAREQGINIFDKVLNTKDLETLLGTHPTAIKIPLDFNTINNRSIRRAISEASLNQLPAPARIPAELEVETLI